MYDLSFYRRLWVCSSYPVPRSPPSASENTAGSCTPDRWSSLSPAEHKRNNSWFNIKHGQTFRKFPNDGEKPLKTQRETRLGDRVAVQHLHRSHIWSLPVHQHLQSLTAQTHLSDTPVRHTLTSLTHQNKKELQRFHYAAENPGGGSKKLQFPHWPQVGQGLLPLGY